MTVDNLLCVCGKPVLVKRSTCGAALCEGTFSRFLRRLMGGAA